MFVGRPRPLFPKNTTSAEDGPDARVRLDGKIRLKDNRRCGDHQLAAVMPPNHKPLYLVTGNFNEVSRGGRLAAAPYSSTMCCYLDGTSFQIRWIWTSLPLL